MGLVAVGVNTMGVITAGPMSMGLIQIRSTTNPRYLAYPSREEAEEQARQLGCEGVHRMGDRYWICLLYTSPSPRDRQKSRMPSSA